MITITKTQEPGVLRQHGLNWVNNLMGYVNAGQPIPDNVKGKYRHREIKDALIQETNGKCAYCESKIPHIDYGDIEHIIPKSKHPDKTFLWENLTLGCAKCNGNKLDYYNPNLPLLNPYTDNPEEKLRFAGPLCVAALGSQSAVITIKKIKLNRAELFERRTDYLNRIEPLIRQYEHTSDDQLRRLLLQDLLDLTKSDQEYSSMVKQFLDQLAITA